MSHVGTDEAMSVSNLGNSSPLSVVHHGGGGREVDDNPLRYSASTSDTKVEQPAGTPLRQSTLRKNASLRKRTSLRRTRSGKSLRADDLRNDDYDSVFYTPIPTSGTPTDVLAERFQAWRKLLKDLITYFREIQTSYETRSKALVKISNVVNNTSVPSIFLSEGGIDEANKILRNYHKLAVNEANKARDIENDVVTQLNGLRSDLNQKIKEIKSLSGDFKNSVDKEKDATRKAVNSLQDALTLADSDPSSASGKSDPFIVRLQVEKQVEKQIEEENYLHRAYLNLEGSGRELESIVVGEIQKAYNAYAGIIRREAESAHNTIDDLRAGPLAMLKDHEWDSFVKHDPHFIDPSIPLRKLSHIRYPGQSNPAASEIRAGPLERKSKYLKSYTPGWYVLSPTHLHEFKSPDHIHTQQPVMSLFLLDQKLGSHSQSDGNSHKFSLKGKQAGGMHRGHSWVFRAESFDTMMAWYEDIRALTEKTGAERNAFVRKHARSVSGGSFRAASVSSDGLEEDEADRVPYSAADQNILPVPEPRPQRPEPGGRFPSDLNLDRIRSQAPLSPSGSSVDAPTATDSPHVDREAAAAPAAAVLMTSATTDSSHVAPDERSQISELPADRESPQPTANSVRQSSAVSYPTDSASPAVVATAFDGPPANAATEEQAAYGTLTHHELRDFDVRPGPSATTAAVSTQDFAANDPVSSNGTLGNVSQKTRDALAAAGTKTPDGHFTRTGHLMPSVLRHDTQMSVSDLHVPGEYSTTQRAAPA